MGQKINPTSMRIPVTKDWKSRWFAGKNYPSLLKEDLAIRSILSKRFRGMGVDRIIIERSPNALTIQIVTSRPGLLIGKGGNGVEEIRRIVSRIVRKKLNVRIDVQEVKNPE